MGIKRKSETLRWTEELMRQHLLSFRSTARYVLQNLYVFGWESDILFLSKSGFWTEIEIKVSRSDFKADAKNKIEKHKILSTKDNHFKPNQFFYAIPKGLVLPDEIPEYAGLLEIRNRGFHPEIKIPAIPDHVPLWTVNWIYSIHFFKIIMVASIVIIIEFIHRIFYKDIFLFFIFNSVQIPSILLITSHQ